MVDKWCSLAHWDGLQPYSDEDTSRGNLVGDLDLIKVAISKLSQVLALLTGGEGNHNFVSAFSQL